MHISVYLTLVELPVVDLCWRLKSDVWLSKAKPVSTLYTINSLCKGIISYRSCQRRSDAFSLFSYYDFDAMMSHYMIGSCSSEP